MITLAYRVHGASRHRVEREVELKSGAKVVALVLVLEVELVPVDHAGGSIVQRFDDDGGPEGAALLAAFAPGALIDVTFAPKGA